MLSFAASQREGATVLAVVGAVQAVDNVAFAKELDRLRAAPPARLVLDLARTEYLNSRALGEIVSLYQHLRAAGSALAVAAPRPAVLKIMRFTGLCDLLGVFPDVAAALAASGGKGAGAP